MDPNLTNSTLMLHLGAAFLLVHGLQIIKSWAKIPWISKHTDKANMLISALWGFASANGIILVASPDGWLSGGGTVHVPPIAQLGAALLSSLGQVMLQQAYYHGSVKTGDAPTSASIAQEVMKALPAYSKEGVKNVGV